MVSSPTARALRAPQLERIHAQGIGELVHEALGREHDLGLAEPAEGPAGDLVRPHHPGVHPHVGDAIGAAGVDGAPEENHGGQRRVGAAVEEIVHLGRHQVSLAGGPELHLDAAGMPLRHGGHVFLARQDEPHGPTGGHGQEGRVGPGARRRVFLAPEAAARDGLHDAHAIQVEAEGGGDGLLHVEGALQGAHHRHPARAVGHGDHPVGLDVGVLLVGRVVGALHHHEVAAREGGRGLASPHLPVRQHLARPQRVFHVEGGRARLVVDEDRGQGLAQGLSVVGGHEGHGLAHVTHELAGQDRPVGLDHGDDVLARDVRGAEHGPDAGDEPGLGQIEVGDAGVGVRGAQDAPEQRPREGQVVDVEGAALDLVRRIGSAEALADAHASSWGWVFMPAATG